MSFVIFYHKKGIEVKLGKTSGNMIEGETRNQRTKFVLSACRLFLFFIFFNYLEINIIKQF